MSTRGDTFHILQGHVATANTDNAVSAPVPKANANGGRYKYNAAVHAINKFITEGNPKLLAQTFQVNTRSITSPLDMSPVMMLR